jgi:hypothetical protein
MNWPLIIITGILLIGLLVFLVRRNIKDEKLLEKELKNDYPKNKVDEEDILINEVFK